MTARFFTSDELEGLATAAEFVEAVRDGYRQRGAGAPAKPRTTLPSGDPPGMLTGYGAVLPETGYMGGYTYSAGFGSADAWFVTPLFDAESGEPVAILDGAWMNPYKTGAVGAVAVDALARSDARSLAVVGSGAQARGQLRATATVRDFETVRVYSPTAANRRAFAADFDEQLDAGVEAVESSQAAVSGADVVITATTASDPVFDGSDLAAGAHVTAMGQYHPEKREVDHETVRRARYVLDLEARADQDAGSLLSAREAGVVGEDHVHAELGSVLTGDAQGRTDDQQVTLFDSGGTAIETVAGAALLYERARERELGSELEFTPASDAFETEDSG